MTNVEGEPAWVRPSVAQLDHLLQLPGNWDSYGAAPTDPRAARMALQLLAMIMNADTPAPTVVPTVRGGVQLEWHHHNVDLEIELPPNGPAHVAYENFTDDRRWEGELRFNPLSLVGALAELSRRG